MAVRALTGVVIAGARMAGLAIDERIVIKGGTLPGRKFMAVAALSRVMPRGTFVARFAIQTHPVGEGPAAGLVTLRALPAVMGGRFVEAVAGLAIRGGFR